MAACEPDTTADGYAFLKAVLLKRTLSTRRHSLRSLRELYGLSSDLLVFCALRDLWDEDVDSQPPLASLCASVRDSLFAATADLILSLPYDSYVVPDSIAEAVEEAFPGRFRPETLSKVGRNAASSWRQSGHLDGHRRKVRVRALCTPVATTYALFLGYRCGARGTALYQTIWSRMLDAPEHEVREMAMAASRQGWLEYRAFGGVTEITFRHLLRDRRAA